MALKILLLLLTLPLTLPLTQTQRLRGCRGGIEEVSEFFQQLPPIRSPLEHLQRPRRLPLLAQMARARTRAAAAARELLHAFS